MNALKKVFRPGSAWVRVNSRHPDRAGGRILAPAGTPVRVQVERVHSDSVAFKTQFGDVSYLAWPHAPLLNVKISPAKDRVEIYDQHGALLTYTAAPPISEDKDTEVKVTMADFLHNGFMLMKLKGSWYAVHWRGERVGAVSIPSWSKPAWAITWMNLANEKMPFDRSVSNFHDWMKAVVANKVMRKFPIRPPGATRISKKVGESESEKKSSLTPNEFLKSYAEQPFTTEFIPAGPGPGECSGVDRYITRFNGEPVFTNMYAAGTVLRNHHAIQTDYFNWLHRRKPFVRSGKDDYRLWSGQAQKDHKLNFNDWMASRGKEWVKESRPSMTREEKKRAALQTYHVKVGGTYWFEYHCEESDVSADADLWYHSHQQCKVLRMENPGYGKDIEERGYNGDCAGYRIQFADGFQHSGMEDELLYSRNEFMRPDPPLPPQKRPDKGKKSLSWPGGIPGVKESTSPVNPDEFLSHYMDNHFRLVTSPSNPGSAIVLFGGKAINEININSDGRQSFEDMFNWCNRKHPYNPSKPFYMWLQDITDKGLRQEWRHKAGIYQESEPDNISPDELAASVPSMWMIRKPSEWPSQKNGDVYQRKISHMDEEGWPVTIVITLWEVKDRRFMLVEFSIENHLGSHITGTNFNWVYGQNRAQAMTRLRRAVDYFDNHVNVLSNDPDLMRHRLRAITMKFLKGEPVAESEAGSMPVLLTPENVVKLLLETRIVAAAIRLKDGSKFTGPIHAVAVEKAIAAGKVAPHPAGIGDVVQPYERGYMTDDGEFVMPLPAQDIANQADQITKDATTGQPVNLRKGGLDSLDLVNMGESEVDPGDVFASYSKANPFRLIFKKSEYNSNHYAVYYLENEVGEVQLGRHSGGWFQKYMNWLNSENPYSEGQSFDNWLDWNNDTETRTRYEEMTESAIDPNKFISGYIQNRWSVKSKNSITGTLEQWFYFGDELQAYDTLPHGLAGWYVGLFNWLNRRAPYAPIDAHRGTVALSDERNAVNSWMNNNLALVRQYQQDNPVPGAWQPNQEAIDPDKFLSKYIKNSWSIKHKTGLFPGHPSYEYYFGHIPQAEMDGAPEVAYWYLGLLKWLSARVRYAFSRNAGHSHILHSDNWVNQWLRRNKELMGQYRREHPMPGTAPRAGLPESLQISADVVEALLNPDKFLSSFVNRPFVLKPDTSYLYSQGTVFMVLFDGYLVDCVRLPTDHPHSAKEYERYYNWLNDRTPLAGHGSEEFWDWLKMAQKNGMGIQDWKKLHGVAESEINPDAFLASFVRHRFRIQYREIPLRGGEMMGMADVYYGHQHVDTVGASSSEESRKYEEYLNWLNSGQWKFNYKKSAKDEYRPWLVGATAAGLWDDFNKRHWEERKSD